MARVIDTTPVLTSYNNNAIHPTTQPSWQFLFNDISTASDGKLNFRALCCFVTALICIGCEGALFSKLGRSIFSATFGEFELFGAYLLALSIFVILIYHHKVYILICVFILSFYELIKLLRIIVSYSVVIAAWDKKNFNSISDDSDLSTVKALTISCLVCATIGLFLVLSLMGTISHECKIQTDPILLPQQMAPVVYPNPIANTTPY